MTTMQHRRIHLLFRLAMAAVLTLGAARVVLDSLKNNINAVWPTTNSRVPIQVSVDEEIEEGCNVFEGRWIWDNASYPLYREDSCPFLVKQTTCLRNGRSDSFYQKWRWQPHACDLPRFDGLKLMEMLRDRRLMFVGDSVQRGMFESMICLVQSALPKAVTTSLQRIPPRKVFRVEEFNATIEYYWAPFIIESISDHATNHTVSKRLVKLDSVAKHSKEWEGVDILIFESYVWWMYKPTINATYGSLDNIQEYNVTTAYRLAMETWAKWIDSSINPQTQKIFFATMSPTHLWNWEWKPGSDGNCFNETHPLEGPYWGTGSNLDIMRIVEDVLGRVKVNVTVLNITQLSGVPDTWNEILYALLLQDYREE